MRWLLYGLACLLTFVGGTYYYDCRIKQVCGNSTVHHIPLPPLHFGWNDAAAGVESEFAAFKKNVLANGREGDALTITGLYYESEKNASSGGVDLGTLRARAAARLFANDLDPERIQTSSRLLAGDAPVGDSTNKEKARFAAVEFNWSALIATHTIPTVAPPVVFAADSSEAIVGEGFDAMQAALNTGAPNQMLEITGLWFEGETEALGLQRAKAAAKLFAGWLPENNAMFLARFSGANSAELREALLFRWMDAAVGIEATANVAIEPNSLKANASIEVYFHSNGDTILEDANWRAALLVFVEQARGKKVTVRGHTDSSGRAAKNNALGLRRAKALRETLIAAGVSAADISVESLSAIQPKSDNDSASGKALNRRAQATIIE
jgi:outer membrane protein OmpA-like peptidoglycan-associated protein